MAAAYAVALAVAVAVAWSLRGSHPILVAAAADVAATLAVFGFSVRHSNSSVYDPYWSVAPIPIALYWAFTGDGHGARQIGAVALVCAWGLRLTANWVARWNGLADEDFRYVEIRARTGRAYWPASLFSIHLLPTAWVFLGLLPLYPALSVPGRPLGALDAVAGIVAAGAVAIEAAADAQLRAFLRSRREPGEVLDRGLWALCRHPNYLGELLFWWGLWLLGLAAAPSWAWTVAGPMAITLLFLLVSVPWMDRRMLSRHPVYAARMRAVPGLVPRLPRRR